MTLHHLNGRLYWDEPTRAILERDDEGGLRVRDLFGKYLIRAYVRDLDAAWAWVEAGQCRDCGDDVDEAAVDGRCGPCAELAASRCACGDEARDNGRCAECDVDDREAELADLRHDERHDRQGDLFG